MRALGTGLTAGSLIENGKCAKRAEPKSSARFDFVHRLGSHHMMEMPNISPLG